MKRRALAVTVVLALTAIVVWYAGGRQGDEPAPAASESPEPEAWSPKPPAAAAPPPAPAPARPLTLSPATVSPTDAAAGVLAGAVLDWGTGAPVAGAEVAIEGAEGTSSFVSGPDGRFEVTPPAPGRYRVVSALAAGYLPWAPEASPLELVARPRQRIDGVVIYLVPAIEYRGRVVTPDGEPAPGATVVLLDAAAGERARAPIDDRFVADDEGGFTFRAPDGALLEARHDGFAPGRAVVDGAVTVSRELTITLGARGGAAPADLTIAGVVVDASGAPVGGARVTAEAGELARRAVAETDADGRFVVGPLDPGTHAVVAHARGHAPVAVAADAGAAGVELRLGAAARITGRVVDPGGAPVPAASIVVLARAGVATRTVAVAQVFDAEGRFAVEDVAAGDYQLLAQAHGWAPSELTAATASARPDDVTVTVRRGATLVGVMRDAATKAPLPNGKVSVEGGLGEGSSAVPLAQTAITGADGGFELAGVAPGRRSIHAGAYAHHMMIVGPLEVADGARIGPIEIDLSPVAPGETPRIELAGIGAALSAQDDHLRVDRVFDGGGAAQAGLVAGDQVLAVDGTPVTELGLEGAIQRIRGPVGTVVVLRLRRGEATEDVRVTRTKIRA